MAPSGNCRLHRPLHEYSLSGAISLSSLRSTFMIAFCILLLVPVWAIHRYPDYFIIGAPKCGTTSLYDLLASHPQLCKAKQKEVHYFDNSQRYKQGFSYWTHYYYTDCKGQFLDATPDYFASYETPVRMHRDFPQSTLSNKRFILVLRDPVARAFSWYNHLINHCVAHLRRYTESSGRVSNRTDYCNERHCRGLQCGQHSPLLVPGNEISMVATFAAFANSSSFPLEVGHYTEHLKRWLQYFRRDQILVLNFEHMLHNTSATVRSITQFLGLRYAFSPSLVLPHDNRAQVPTVLDCATRDALRKVYQPHIEALYAVMDKGEGKLSSEPPFGRFEEVAECV